MTKEQAAAELGRLCGALGKDARDLKPEQVTAYMRELQSMNYERGREAIQAVIDQWEHGYFPPIGFFNARARQIDYEGQPNASAYRQDAGHTPWSRTEAAAFAFWRQQQIEHMAFPLPSPDEEPEDEEADRLEVRYWTFVHDQEYRRRCDDEWRRMWHKGAA